MPGEMVSMVWDCHSRVSWPASSPGRAQEASKCSRVPAMPQQTPFAHTVVDVRGTVLVLLLHLLGSPLKHPLGDLKSSLKSFLRYSPRTPEGDKQHQHRTAEVAQGGSASSVLGFLGEAEDMCGGGVQFDSPD